MTLGRVLTNSLYILSGAAGALGSSRSENVLTENLTHNLSGERQAP